MIELNLLEKKQPLRLPNVLGVDLNELNYKALVFAIVFYYVPEIFVRNSYDDKFKVEDDILVGLRADNAKIIKEIGKNTDVKAQLKAYNEQVNKLKARSVQVDEILKIQTNPKKVLEKIARSIPEDLWFEELKITVEKDVFISGGAYSSRSIGEFITLINDSPFFGSSITPVKQENKQSDFDGVLTSYEIFSLKGKIKNYDMRAR